MGRRAVWGISALAAALQGGAARAETSRLRLDWSAPPGCPDERAVRERVDALLGRPAESFLGRPLDVRGTVTSGGAGADLLLETTQDGLPGRRTLTGGSCAEVSAAGALVIALAIDPNAVAERERQGATAAFPEGAPPAPRPPEPHPPTVTPGPTAASQAPAPAARTAPTTHGRVEAELVVDAGSLPGMAVGPALAAGFSTSVFAVGLDAGYLFPRFAPDRDDPAAGADVSLFFGGVTGCYRALPGDVELRPCARVEVGAFVATGTRFAQESTSDVVPWFAAGAGGEVAVHTLPPLALRLGLGAAVPVPRQRVRVRKTESDFATLHRPSGVVGRATLAVGFAFE